MRGERKEEDNTDKIYVEEEKCDRRKKIIIKVIREEGKLQ